MGQVSVRYIVDDVATAIDFYCGQLGFQELMHPAPSFAIVVREDLRLLLSAASREPGGGQIMADGSVPVPGGWNRISLQVASLEPMVARLRGAGVRFRNEIVEGVGGRQILIEDPSGNPIELFEPVLAEARNG
ncbi:MAG TPA: VOC family protein [Candidatus Dormibacteraeota bacterium]